MVASWKTTITGCIGAVLTVLIPLLKNGTLDPQTLALAAVIAVMGVLAKDFDQSGLPK
jgi:hypothetical protein